MTKASTSSGLVQCSALEGLGKLGEDQLAASKRSLTSSPMKVPVGRLRRVLGIANVRYTARKHSLAVVDSTFTNAGAGSR